MNEFDFDIFFAEVNNQILNYFNLFCSNNSFINEKEELYNTFRESFLPIIEIFKEVSLAGWVGFLTTIITMSVLTTLVTHKIIFSSKDKKIDRAKTLGHSVIAHCVNTKEYDREGRRRRYYYIYEYNLNGKVEHQNLDSEHVLPNQLRFYYDDKTGKIISLNPGWESYFKFLVPFVSLAAGGLVSQLFK